MHLSLQVDPGAEELAAVEYRRDADTDILSARLTDGRAGGHGFSGSVDIEGTDGSWLVLDVDSGRIRGVEVAVWPDVKTRRTLAPPDRVETACVTLPARSSAGEEDSLELETALAAEADEGEHVIYFRMGSSRAARTIRIARDVLLDLDSGQRMTGLWLLNVPPHTRPDVQ